MALNKANIFDEQEKLLATYAKALSHPARIAILKKLATSDTCICGEIVEVLPLAQSTVSQHLRELLSAGLIQGAVDGPRSCYCINWEAFEQMQDMLGLFTNGIQEKREKLKCC